MRLIFKTLTMKNFKSHQDLTVNFGEVTKITGDNGKGKSTILESLSFVLYGIDTFGRKSEPSPITYETDETKVSLLFSFNGKNKLLERCSRNGKASYYIDEVPKTATEFSELVEQLFGNKELFLSLLNPSFYFTLTKDKQRSLLMQYVIAPANKEVIKHMPDEQGKYLGTLLKKHSLEDLKEIHAKSKTSLDKKYIAAQSRTKTLKEQLEQFNDMNVPLESLKVEISQIDKQVWEKEALLDSIWENNQAYNSLQAKIRGLQDQIEMSKDRWPYLKNEVIEDTCKTCKRLLDEESVEAVKEDKQARMDLYQVNHKKMRTERDRLKLQLAKMEFNDLAELREEIRKLDESGQPLRAAIQNYSQITRLTEQIQEAAADEKDTLTSRNESIIILDSIKAFKAKEAELQAEKLQALFETLSIRLFETQINGEVKNTFEIEMNGKPYRVLSLSEGIRAGLELRDVLSEQSNLITPVFVDNAESITSFKQPVGQLILSMVVAGQELKIEEVDA